MNTYLDSNSSVSSSDVIGAGPRTSGAGNWSRYVGVLITAALIAVIEILNRYVSPVPTPVGIGMLGVVYAAFVGGTWPGMVSAALLALYGAYCFSMPGAPFQFTAEGLWRLIVAIIVPPTIVLMIGTLRRRSERVGESLRRESILKAQIDERSRIGRELQRERNEQQSIFHSVPAMIWFKDANNRILRANRLAAQSIGRTVQEVEGKSTFELYPGEAGKYQQDDLEVIQSGRPKLGIIERYEIPSGEKRWVRTDKIPYRNSADEIVGVIVFAVDITEQKEAQEELQRAHDELDHRVQERTAALTQANENLRREIAERLQAEQVITERTVMAQFAADVGVALTRGEDLRTLLERCCEAVVRRLGAAFARIWTLNEAAATLELQASAGMYTHIDGGHARVPVGSLKIGWIAQERKAHLTNCVVGDPRIGDQEWAKREKMISFAGYPLLIGDRVVGVMAMFARKALSTLVTDAMAAVADTLALGIERHRAAAELRQHAAALEEANIALRQAEEAALAATRAKSRFLANISHEIRTPIMAMLGAAELLQSGDLARKDYADRGDMILRNGRHLLSLVDQLLDLSRLEAGKLEIRPEDCSLLDMLADVEAITEPLRRQKRLDYRIDFETSVPDRISTDCTRLIQAVTNLVNNAFKFTEKGHVWLRVRVVREPTEPVLTISVEDTGIGIRPEDRQRVFDSFAQVEPVSRGPTAGVGLGLPIARWIAEKLGGTLEVQSNFGKGSTFTLRVSTGPLEDVSWITPTEAAERMRSTSPKASRSASYRLQGRVLLAEDAGDTRELIQYALRRCGAEVTAVENGRKAVEAAMRDAFDLILLDIRMPELDGLGAAAELRRRGCRAPLIALTASTSVHERERILACGFDDFWSKPISLDDLEDRVAMYLPTSSEGVVDRGGGGTTDDGRLAAVVAEFVASLPARVGAIRAAVEGGDFLRAGELLHQLVGTCGIHGFMSLSREAGRLLQIIKNGTSIAVAELRSLEDLIANLPKHHSPSGSATESPAPKFLKT